MSEQLLSQLQSVLSAASAECHVVKEELVADFYEPVASKIVDSYIKKLQEYTEGVETEEDVEKILGDVSKTTVSARFSENYYAAQENPFYRLYHDITIACFLGVNAYKRGSKIYALVDKYYKFSSELILRSCFKIGSGLDMGSSVEPIETEYAKSVQKQFDQISSSYTIPMESQLHISTQELLFFSSLVMKSSLDKRGDMLPHPDMEVVDVIPIEASSTVKAAKLGAIIPSITNVPEPTLPSTKILSSFIHPNWYVLPATVWIKYSEPEFKNLLPTIIDAGTMLDSTQRSIYWFEKIGYLQKWKERERENEKLLGSSESSVMETDDETVDKHEEVSSDAVVSLDNLLSWSPTHYFSKEEYETLCTSVSAVQKLVTKNMLKLKSLQKIRLSRGELKPSKRETRLFYTIERLMKFVLLHGTDVDKIDIKHVNVIPVLQANYIGNIPIVRQQIVHHPTKKTKKYKRT